MMCSDLKLSNFNLFNIPNIASSVDGMKEMWCSGLGSAMFIA